MARLEADPEWVAARAREDAELKRRAAEFGRAEAPGGRRSPCGRVCRGVGLGPCEYLRALPGGDPAPRRSSPAAISGRGPRGDCPGARRTRGPALLGHPETAVPRRAALAGQRWSCLRGLCRRRVLRHGASGRDDRTGSGQAPRAELTPAPPDSGEGQGAARLGNPDGSWDRPRPHLGDPAHPQEAPAEAVWAPPPSDQRMSYPRLAARNAARSSAAIRIALEIGMCRAFAARPRRSWHAAKVNPEACGRSGHAGPEPLRDLHRLRALGLLAGSCMIEQHHQSRAQRHGTNATGALKGAQTGDMVCPVVGYSPNQSSGVTRLGAGPNCRPRWREPGRAALSAGEVSGVGTPRPGVTRKRCAGPSCHPRWRAPGVAGGVDRGRGVRRRYTRPVSVRPGAPL